MFFSKTRWKHYMLYLLPLGYIFSKYAVSFHLYADDTQLCSYLNKIIHALEVLLACFLKVNLWLTHTFFFGLNENTTEVILFEPSDFYDSGLPDINW